MFFRIFNVKLESKKRPKIAFSKKDHWLRENGRRYNTKCFSIISCPYKNATFGKISKFLTNPKIFGWFLKKCYFAQKMRFSWISKKLSKIFGRNFVGRCEIKRPLFWYITLVPSIQKIATYFSKFFIDAVWNFEIFGKFPKNS